MDHSTPDQYFLEQLDRHWESGIIPDIHPWICSLATVDVSACIELCSADLEWRWQRLKPDQFGSKRPTATDYADLLANIWESIDCRRKLFESEWISRCIWGDRPQVDTFVSQCTQCELESRHLTHILNQICPVKALVTLNGSVCLELLLPSEFTIGRQNQAEIAPPGWNSDASRMILADLKDRRYSREQLKIRRTSYMSIEIANASSKADISLRGDILKPQQRFSVALPYGLMFSAYVLELEV